MSLLTDHRGVANALIRPLRGTFSRREKGSGSLALRERVAEGRVREMPHRKYC